MAGKIKPEIKHIIYKNGNEKGKKTAMSVIYLQFRTVT